MNIKLILSYDGTAYFGWQKTKTGPSVQETVEQALFKILRKPVSLEAASRTDRGVHAKAQSAHFFWDEPIDFFRLQHGLNAVLPADIRALKLEVVDDTFHPTLDALKKEYRYQICLGPIQEPLRRLYSWHLPQLDLAAMETAIVDFIGIHDFSAFTTEEVEDGVRTLYNVKLLQHSHQLEIHLLGDRFLYKMARRIVGTLVAIGKGTLTRNQVLSLFKTPDRTLAGMTAPAHGLTLHQVYYRDKTLLETR